MIKKSILLSVFFSLSSAAFAQQNIDKVGIVSGNAGIQYERSLSERFSVLGQVGNTDIDTKVNNVESNSSGTGFYLEARYYSSAGKDLMEGWHMGPYYNSIRTKNDKNERIDITSIGISAGYQFVFASRITAEFVFGGGSLDLKSDRLEVEFSGDIGFFPHIGLTVGYVF